MQNLSSNNKSLNRNSITNSNDNFNSHSVNQSQDTAEKKIPYKLFKTAKKNDQGSSNLKNYLKIKKYKDIVMIQIKNALNK